MTQASESRDVILITGASGLIGTRLAAAFQDDFIVVGMDVAQPHTPNPTIAFLETDLTDETSVHRSFRSVLERYGERIASVLHLAAYYDFSGEPSPLYKELTVEGTRRLLRGLHECRLQVEQFVFSSSLLVMAPAESGEPLTEASPVRPEWAYPQSKLEAEQVIREEHADIPVVILRIAGVYDAQCHSLPISQQIARIFEQQLESHFFPGDKTHGQALVHLDDLVECFVKVVSQRRSLGPEELFLIAEPDVMSYGELQDKLGELIHGREWQTLRIPKVVAKAGAWVQDKLADEGHKPFIKPWMVDLADDHLAANITQARDKLGWVPQNRLRDTLSAITTFLKNDPQHFYEVNKLPIPEEVGSRSEPAKFD